MQYDAIPLNSPYGLDLELAGTALFLDVEGALLEQPFGTGGEALPARTRDLVERLCEATFGALALISARSLDELAAIGMPPGSFLAGLYGMESRAGDGTIVTRLPENFALVAAVTDELRDFADHHSGLLLTDRRLALSIWCAGSGELVQQTLARMQNALSGLGPAYHLVQRGNLFEIKPRRATRGNAIRDHMVVPPFLGRKPLFVGGDPGAEDGFAVVNDRDGVSIRIGHVRRGMTRARYALPSVDALLDWFEFVLRRSG